FVSRAIADTVWVWTAGRVSENVGGLFLHQLTSWQSIVLQVAALAAVVLLFRLPWVRWLGLEHAAAATGSQEEAAGRRSGST
ncbi:MAG TPA: hypothetical protein VH916_10495, partial [Dehalococcoidia bacterium]